VFLGIGAASPLQAAKHRSTLADFSQIARRLAIKKMKKPIGSCGRIGNTTAIRLDYRRAAAAGPISEDQHAIQAAPMVPPCERL